MASLLIKNGKIFIEGKFEDKEILIDDGRISKIGGKLNADREIDAKGRLVIPGLIDPHVHMREPGAQYKEDFETGSKAAIAGGFTTVLDMPNNNPPTTTYTRLMEKKRLAEKALCNVGFHFGATDDNQREVRKVNPSSMKMYLSKTTGELLLRRPRTLEKHFSNIFPSTVLVFHANSTGPEEQAIVETMENIDRIGGLSQKYKRKIHIAHASCGAEVKLSKSYGASVEVAPHHLLMNSADAKRLGCKGSVYPELRSEELRQSLWDSFDLIDCMATDHAPHTLEDKQEGAHGFPGLETALGLMLDAWNHKLINIEKVVEMMTSKPADIFNLQKVGRIKKGFFGDITIIDPKKEWIVKEEELYTKCGWSPWDGKKLKGKVETVIIRGKQIYEDGKVKPSQ